MSSWATTVENHTDLSEWIGRPVHSLHTVPQQYNSGAIVGEANELLQLAATFSSKLTVIYPCAFIIRLHNTQMYQQTSDAREFFATRSSSRNKNATDNNQLPLIRLAFNVHVNKQVISRFWLVNCFQHEINWRLYCCSALKCRHFNNTLRCKQKEKRKSLFDEADLAIMYLVQWQLSQYRE
jgi:hypothetical protein